MKAAFDSVPVAHTNIYKRLVRIPTRNAIKVLPSEVSAKAAYIIMMKSRLKLFKYHTLPI